MPIPVRDQRSYRGVMQSRTEQRAADPRSAPTSRPGTKTFERSGAIILGPGSYTPKAGIGHAFGARQGPDEWERDPRRQGSAFRSRTQKGKMARPITAECFATHGKAYGDFNRRATQGDVPGSDGRKWGKDARKPPHFHIPFRAYPFEGGEPRGREKGLDTFYEVDAVSASPSALHATLAVNMKRTPLTYAPVFKSRLPSRPRTASTSTPDDIGPGRYEITHGDHTNARTAVNLRQPHKQSAWAIPHSGGMYKGVGGVYEHHDLY